MPIFTKESLETLRHRVDLVEVLSSHIELKRSGASYKGLCPFHDEKSPSLILQKGDRHYHCFGCGAHGDAIQFLMAHQKMSFSDAVESLAQRFHVHLEISDDREKKAGPNKGLLKDALAYTSKFFHLTLLHTAEGHQALDYLYQRGLDLDFIRHFGIGLSPKEPGRLQRMTSTKKISDEVLIDAGLLHPPKNGRCRDFFLERIMFPIHNGMGDVIGFSARKYREETFGGKYVNTPETALFKKSRTLFGLNYSRKRIAKERKAIIVEGQIDALRLIDAGLDLTVAGQGTAFGEGHVKELALLGVNQVFLALDSDNAGQEATAKIGHLFQKEGIETHIVSLPVGLDPDSFLSKKGSQAFLKIIEESSDYLGFLVKHLSRDLNLDSPAGKNELIQNATKLIREWDHPVMVHETLRKLAHSMRVPEDYVGVGREEIPNIHIKKSASIGVQTIDPDRILETDFLRWLLLFGQNQPKLLELAKDNLKSNDLHVRICQKIYTILMENYANNRSLDLLSLAIDLDDTEGQLVLSDLVQKKINRDRAEQQLVETIQRILDRNWMETREAIKVRIQSGHCSDEEAHSLAKEFDLLKRNSPRIMVENKDSLSKQEE